MKAWAAQRVAEPAEVGLRGFVFKKDSPQPISGTGVGEPAGVPTSVSEGADVGYFCLHSSTLPKKVGGAITTNVRA
jgi:hypothetical protein